MDFYPIRQIQVQRKTPTAAGIPPKQLKAIKSAIEIGSFPFYFFGTPGSGKSCAAAVVAMAWPGKVYFVSAKKIIADYSFGGHKAEIMNLISEFDLIVLDEIGLSEFSPAQCNAIFDILERRGRMPMILTGNHDLDTLGTKIGDARISSRITQGTLIAFPDVDLRLAGTVVFDTDGNLATDLPPKIEAELPVLAPQVKLNVLERLSLAKKRVVDRARDLMKPSEFRGKSELEICSAMIEKFPQNESVCDLVLAQQKFIECPIEKRLERI